MTTALPIAKLPRGWTVGRLKATILATKNGIWGEDGDGGRWDIPCVRVADFDRTQLTAGSAPTTRRVEPSHRKGRVLQRGDLLIEKSGGGEKQPVGCVVEYTLDEPAVCSNFVARIETAHNFAGRYVAYLHAALYAGGITARNVKQSTGIQNLDAAAYFDERVPLPPLKTQRAIADFLDRKTAAIDALIEKKERLIALLEEKRQALITQAVTKGLDPTVPMKDSGIEWLGEIPAHWEVPRIGYVATVKNGSTPSRARRDYWSSGTIPWLASGKVNDDIVEECAEFITEIALRECSVSLVAAGAVLVGMVGQGRTRGMSAFLAIDACINQNMAALSPSAKIEGLYLYGVLRAGYETLRNTGRGGQQDALNCQIIRDHKIPLPPLAEQVAIVRRLEANSRRVSRLREKLAEQQSRLREYRQAVITAAVTGQLDIPVEPDAQAEATP